MSVVVEPLSLNYLVSREEQAKQLQSSLAGKQLIELINRPKWPILEKMSSPGWIKQFESEAELKTVLWSHICKSCRTGEINSETGELYPFSQGVTEESSIDEMLATPCGCEFDVEFTS